MPIVEYFVLIVGEFGMMQTFFLSCLRISTNARTLYKIPWESCESLLEVFNRSHDHFFR